MTLTPDVLAAHTQVLASSGGMATTQIGGLVVSIICAFACYKIAQGKGRGPILFGVLGFFFSIITLIVVLIIPRKN